MSAPRPLAGVLPVVQTPFTADGTIDEAALRREVDWVVDQGAHGVTTGMVSEILRMTSTECARLAEVVAEQARARGALAVVSCGAESTFGAVEAARHAEAVGADAVMAIPPITVQLEDDALFGYYSAIVEATGLGVVVQDASGYVGRSLSIDLQMRLLDRYGERVYFKPEAAPIGQRLTQLREATGGRARVFEGTGGAALVDSYRRGVVGTMPGAEVTWAIVRLWELVEAGRWDTAYEISGPLSALVALQTSIDVFVAVEKHLLVRQGVLERTDARAPHGFVLDRETRDEVDRLFDLLRARTLSARAA
ncbi:dihydrodipicolinate synthase family protein [Cellulosimicrobium cellulans]|uniref:dihydrodipicolinate synthase family protein n=1 Tax=Cellulosimicrobium cellulans TaxID=1710 RepID=UPI00130EC472|nr:dihydrodipicolinate synthase family protein [Cellulosimicrobium cellulans]